VSKWRTLVKRGEVPAPSDVGYRTMVGSRYLELVAGGGVHAYPLVARSREVRPMPTGAKWRLRDRHRLALAHVVTAHLVCKSVGFSVAHAEMAALLECSERTAGTTMRELVAWGLVESFPMYQPAGAVRLRRPSLYRVSAFAIELFDIRARRGARQKLPGRRSPVPGEELEVSAVADNRSPEAVQGGRLHERLARLTETAVHRVVRAEQRIRVATREQLARAAAVTVRANPTSSGELAAGRLDPPPTVPPAELDVTRPPPAETLDEYRRRLAGEHAAELEARKQRPPRPSSAPATGELDAVIARSFAAWERSRRN